MNSILQRLPYYPKAALVLLFQIAVLALVFTGCDGDGTGNNDEPLPDNIAVYNGSGSWDTSAVAIKLCLESGERTVDLVTEHDIQQSLDDYGMVIIGSGDPLTIATSLGFTGSQRILDLVERGGAYIGLGAGAYLAADSIVYDGQPAPAAANPIGLFEGIAIGPIGSLPRPPNYVLTLVELADEPLNPESLHSRQVLYIGGPEMQISQPAEATSIGIFTTTGQHAGFIFGSGFGRVVLASVHPEIEENDPRDGSEFGAELYDPETDWPWLLTMVEWALRERI